jgi:cardiolipin synthase A/B
MYLLAIAAARREILLGNAYFVPDQLARRELVQAARRGVRVRILVPGEHTDSRLVRWASRAAWGELLEAGVEFYEYQPTMYHCKLFVVDRLLVSVGSTNFDNRSFRLNDEANLNVLDRELAESQAQVLEADLQSARPYTLEDWLARPPEQRLRERVAGVLRGQL